MTMLPITYGYARVSKADDDSRNLDTQLRLLADHGIRRDLVFTDVASGRSMNRPGWQDLIARVQPRASRKGTASSPTSSTRSRSTCGTPAPPPGSSGSLSGFREIVHTTGVPGLGKAPYDLTVARRVGASAPGRLFQAFEEQHDGRDENPFCELPPVEALQHGVQVLFRHF